MKALVIYMDLDKSHNWSIGNISVDVNSYPTSIRDIRSIEEEIEKINARKTIVLNIIPFMEEKITNAERIRSMTDEQLSHFCLNLMLVKYVNMEIRILVMRLEGLFARIHTQQELFLAG